MLEQLEQLAAADERRARRRAERAVIAPESPRTADRPSVDHPAANPSERRADAARRGWATRRANAERRQRQTWHVNPERSEFGGKETGDGVYVLYEAAHPLRGDPETRAEWESRLAPYYGHRVRVSLNGYYVDPESGEPASRIYFTATEQLNSYADFFGPDSIYMRLAKRVRNSSSESELVVTSVSVELADDRPSTADAARERTKRKADAAKAKRARRKRGQ